MAVLRKYQIKWIAEQFLRDSLRAHDKERAWMLGSNSWQNFLRNISMDAPSMEEPRLTEAVKDAVVEYVRIIYKDRTGKDPESA